MKTVLLGNSSLACSPLAYGCWRIAGTWNPAEVKPEAQASGRRAVLAAYEAGYTLFDHADIYCEGMAETIFGRVLKEEPAMRDRILIATKCGIRKLGEPKPDSPYRYDFSGEHIVSSCEQSLRRLGVERIDIYQLHRPDYLMNPEEIAAAFGRLKRSGKVREFGVSNFRPSQLAALQKACPMRLIVNQVEISLANLAAFEDPPGGRATGRRRKASAAFAARVSDHAIGGHAGPSGKSPRGEPHGAGAGLADETPQRNRADCRLDQSCENQGGVQGRGTRPVARRLVSPAGSSARGKIAVKANAALMD